MQSIVKTLAEKVIREAVAVAIKVVQNRDTAEDIASEAIFRLLSMEAQLIARKMDEEEIRKYFFAILKNCCFDYLNSKKRKPEEELAESPYQEEGYGQVEKIDIESVLEKIDDGTRICLLLVGMGYDYTAIADQFGVQPTAIARRVFLARRKLKSLGLNSKNSHFVLDGITELNIPKQAEDWLSTYDFAKLTKRDHRTVKNKINQVVAKYQIKSERRRTRNGHTTDYWPPVLLDYLVIEVLRYQDSGDWLTLPMIAKNIRQGRYWTETQLIENGINFELRRTPKGRIYPHYHPSVLVEFRQLSNGRMPAGESVTAKAIEKELGWNKFMVKKRLVQIAAVAMLKSDSHGVTRDHYDRSVIDQLRAMPVLPDKGNWLNKKDISRRGYDYRTINNRLETINIPSEWRRESIGGRECICYPPEIIEHFP
jgi:RNA polymerase sigma factor (sigma-70 family)